MDNSMSIVFHYIINMSTFKQRITVSGAPSSVIVSWTLKSLEVVFSGEGSYVKDIFKGKILQQMFSFSFFV